MVENHSETAPSGSRDRDPYLTQLRPVGSFFRDHPAIALSLVYLQVTTVGVVYSWWLFWRFDINIFDYAETNDFLLAAFKDPIVFAMSVLSIVGLTLLTLHVMSEIHAAETRRAQVVIPHRSPIIRTPSSVLLFLIWQPLFLIIM